MTKPGMNYEDMIERCVDGLGVIESASGSVPVVAHAYMVAVPGVDMEDYSDEQIANLQDWGWVHHEDFGWVLAVLA